MYWDITEPEAKIIHRLEGHDAVVNDAVFLPSGVQAVSVSDDGTLGIWDLEAGKLIIRIDAPQDKVLDVAVSPDGNLASVARWDKTVRVYDLRLQKEIAALKGHRGNVNAVAFSSDGRFMYSAGYDGQILEWEVSTLQFIRPVYRHGWGINSIAMLDDNRVLFGALDGTVAAVNIERAERVLDFAKRELPIQSVKVSPDKSLAAFGDGTGQIQVFAVSSGKKIEGDEVTFGPVWDFAFVPATNFIYPGESHLKFDSSFEMDS